MTTAFEVGTDLSFLNDRLGLNFTWYQSNIKDLITNVATAATTGFTTITLNSGDIQNKGVELTLSGVPVKNKDLTWTLLLNYSSNRNKVLSIYPGLTQYTAGSSFGYGGSGPSFIIAPGQPVGNIYGTHWERYYGNKTPDPLIY